MKQSEQHNARVASLAARMPMPKGATVLTRTVRAIGYSANFETGETMGFGVGALATRSRRLWRGRFKISERNLTIGIAVLEMAGVLEVERTVAKRGRRGKNVYRLVWDYQDTARVEAAYRAVKAGSKAVSDYQISAPAA